jgi:cbb3-type cytochrome oxidase subunit 1
MSLGLVIMFVDLLAAGLVHGNMQKGLSPWMDIVRMLQPYWAVRTFAGAMIVTGLSLWVFNLWKTATTPKPYDFRVDLVESKEGA